ncbi:hypothetical protein PG994_008617 [Apiospora phragmitis]|uniref:DUF6590 domain-containing protein n=1 Tax=Apiospora phragmitis TaxID=2905665 RepID=A0ABR1UGZ3_9PEZI
MGKSESSIHTGPKSDSGYGDDAASVHTPSVHTPSVHTPQDDLANHPLARKGYEIGPASSLQIGDVFEFLWADTHEFEWEWKCLGYNRFIVLRHSDTFPHHCVCIPISNGGKIEFAKPGIDNHQQGYVYAEGEVPNEGDRHRLPYSPISIELKPGKLRVKEDSRVNYADILEIDHDSQVMVVGDVARYFDRVRRNVNKATMRKVLVKALEAYRAKKDGEAAAVAALAGDQQAPPPPTPPPVDENHYGSHAPEFAKPNYKPTDSQLSLNLRGGARLHRSRSPTASIRSRAERAGPDRRQSHDQERRHQKRRERERERGHGERGRDRSTSRDTVRDDEVGTSYRYSSTDQETYRLSYAEQERRKEFARPSLPRSGSSRKGQSQSQSQSRGYSGAVAADANAVPSSIAVLRQGASKNSNYDIRSMHDVALAGYQHDEHE